MAAALLIIVLFISIRFEFSFALAAMIAVVHDVLMTIGFYALVGREVNLVTVVAVLTVLGYSLYDTIIIFDRIRENAPSVGYNRRRFDEMVNNSIRQVVMRSIYTSVSTLVPVTALLIFRGVYSQRLRLRAPGRHHSRYLQLALYRLARPLALQSVAGRQEEQAGRVLYLSHEPALRRMQVPTPNPDI